jgi:hypothetical protein
VRWVLLLAALTLPSAIAASEPSLYTGVAGAKVIDSGVFVVSSGSGAREETFEYVQRPDGGFTLVNSITAANGGYRVNGRFDYDAQWNATAAYGTGIYDGVPVAIALERSGGKVAITVAGRGKRSRSVSACAPSCLIDMAPSINPMFVMTRHYDFAAGGEQEFLWAGQDLNKPSSLTDDHVQIAFKDEAVVTRTGAEQMKLRHFYFLENIPQPNGQMFRLAFDLWTDREHRPVAFRVRPPGSSAVGTVGVRKGFEEVRSQILPG